MYVPPRFKQDDLHKLYDLMRRYNFATLFSQADGAPFATHLPFLLDSDRGPYGTLIAHMARANPHWQTWREQTQVLVAFQGPHAYISPSWYAQDELVPTWNYAVAHAYGKPRLVHEPEALLPMVQALVNRHSIKGPQDLNSSKAILLPQLRAIVGFEIPIDKLEGKFKFNQNRSRADQLGVVEALKGSSDPMEREVARIMQENLRAPSLRKG